MKKKRAKVAVDTTVLQKANASIVNAPHENRLFFLRISLLTRFVNEEMIALWSPRLHAEWKEKLKEPRNEFTKAFFEIITSDKALLNYAKPWGGSEMQRMTKCRYPRHDIHLLRTAFIKEERTHLVTEENPILLTATCVKREFDIAIKDISDRI
jgi:hypothetical protein